MCALPGLGKIGSEMRPARQLRYINSGLYIRVTDSPHGKSYTSSLVRFFIGRAPSESTCRLVYCINYSSAIFDFGLAQITLIGRSARPDLCEVLARVTHGAHRVSSEKINGTIFVKARVVERRYYTAVGHLLAVTPNK